MESDERRKLSFDIDDATGQYFVADGGVRSRGGAPLGTAATTKRRVLSFC